MDKYEDLEGVYPVVEMIHGEILVAVMIVIILMTSSMYLFFFSFEIIGK
jgi:hypothetical protein